MIKKICIILIIAVIHSAFATAADNEAIKPSMTDLFISRNNDADEIGKFITKIMFSDMGSRDRLRIIDGATLKTITEFAYSEEFQKSSRQLPILLQKYFTPELQSLKTFVKKFKADPAGSSQIDYIKALDLVAGRNRQFKDSVYHVVILGSPLTDVMNNDAWPSDGYLVNEGDSQYSNFNRENRLDGIYFHFIFDRNLFSGKNPLYKAKIERFLSLMFSMQGGRLITFGENLDLLSNINSTIETPERHYDLDQEDLKLCSHTVESYAAEKTKAVAEKETAAVASNDSQPPAKETVDDKAKVTLCLRWSSGIPLDLDLYVSNKYEQLCFRHPTSPEGYHIKESSNRAMYEKVVFFEKQDLNDLAIEINHYDGKISTSAIAILSITIDDKLYEKDITIPAGEGDEGQKPHNTPYWQSINLFEIIALK